MAAIYLGGTFYAFTAEQVRARQALIEKQLLPHIEVLKPKHTDEYESGLAANLDTTLTMRDKFMVSQADVVVLDLSECERPPRGILIETGWATAWDIPVLVIIPANSPHFSNMLKSLVTWRVDTHAEAALIVNSMLG
jgi:nucleoside 2-deoxyribosyltransferase